MSRRRTHRVTTSDGAAVAATVHGQGPSLVFLHGAFGDGDRDWHALVALLGDRYTCHLPSWRGRGLSDDHPDLSPGRRVDDVVAYADSLGVSVGIVGWSAGAYLALGALAQSEVARGAAVVEPVMARAMDARDRAALLGTLARMNDLAAAGKGADAMRAFGAFVFSADEMAALEGASYFEAAGAYAANLVELHRQAVGYRGPTADDPAVLATVSAPVLVLHGSDTKAFFTRGARLVAEHVPGARPLRIEGVGHAAPVTHAAALAAPLDEFFRSVQ